MLHMTDEPPDASAHILRQIALGSTKIEVVDSETYPATSYVILLPQTAEEKARVKPEQVLMWPKLTALLEDGGRVEAELRRIYSEEAHGN